MSFLLCFFGVLGLRVVLRINHISMCLFPTLHDPGGSPVSEKWHPWFLRRHSSIWQLSQPKQRSCSCAIQTWGHQSSGMPPKDTGRESAACIQPLIVNLLLTMVCTFCKDARITAAKTGNRHIRLDTYLQVCKNFKPVFRHFFMEKFPSPTEWYLKRMAYTRSVAVNSIGLYWL